MGRIIGKYLQRENVAVRCVPHVTHVRNEGQQFAIVIAEIAEGQSDVASYVRAIQEGTACRTLVLVVPMERSSIESHYIQQTAGCKLILISKPIRLSSLVPIIREEITAEEFGNEPGVTINSVG